MDGAFNNTGSVTVQSGTLDLGGAYLQTPGSTTLAGGSLAGTLNIEGGVLTGSGTIAGNVSNGGGHVTPGAAGVLAITGNYTEDTGGALDVDLGPGTPGVGYDLFQVGGTATLDGTLNANLLSAIADLCGASFRVLTFGSRTGDFATTQGLTLPNGLVITPTYDATGLNLVVPMVATTVTLTATADPLLLNQPVTFTATVAPVFSGIETPTGTVQFLVNGVNWGGPVALVNGAASFSTAALAAGNHTITAVYGGDGDCLLGSTGTLAQAVHYSFSGFLPPLNSNLPFGLNRTVPVKFQLTDYYGNPVSNLSAVTALQVLNAQGVDVLAGAGKTGLRFDPSSGQFIYNWQTKGLAAGTYTISLALADGTTKSKTLQLTANGSGANAQVADGSHVSGGSMAGQLLGGDLEVYVDNSNGALTPEELARIQDAITAVDAVTEPYGVTVEETTDPSQAEVTLDMAATSPVGGLASSVLGCFDPATGQITLLQGWNWYAGTNPAQVGASQYDFQTTVTHELGHALGLGESGDPTSVMYGTLAPGTAVRTLTTADLNIPYDEAGAAAQRAAPATPGMQPLAPAGMNDSIRSTALARAVGNAADEGEGNSPALWDCADGAAVVCALVGVYWGARAEGAEPRRRPEQ